MSAHAAPSERSGLGYAPSLQARRRGLTLPRLSALPWDTLSVAVALAAVSFVAGGGLALGSATRVEMALTLGGGAGVAALAIARPVPGPLHGGWAAGLMIALAVLTGLSVAWSVQPDISWQEASRTVAYASFFCLAVMGARALPGRWAAVLGGILLAAVAVSGYALLTKVFPAQLNAGEIFARLREPYGYWNAIGLTAALGVAPCLWLGARRTGRAAVNALAHPALVLLLVTLMLAFSRGALLALVIGLVFLFTTVPLRLRAAAVLLSGIAGAAVVVLWAFSQHALTKDSVPLSQRSAAGHQLGILLLAVCLVVLVAALALNFAAARSAPTERLRRRVGLALAVGLSLVPLALVVGLAASRRGLVGSITHAASSLTDPHAHVPPNDPSRLTAIGSVRARYWNDALKAFKARPVLGTGAGGFATARLRYREDTLNVQHAHGYIVQTLCDLGLVGLAVTLALLAAWLAATQRTVRPYGLHWAGRGVVRREQPFTPERVGLLTMYSLVVVFGVHSLVDWTWFVPGNACVALLCAGWLAGRGPLGAAAAAGARTRVPLPPGARLGVLAQRLRARTAQLAGGAGTPRLVAAAAVLAVALLAAWTEWQPLRANDLGTAAFAAQARRDLPAAERDLAAARSRDPVSVDPLFELAAVQNAAGRRAAAHATLIRAVHLQPANAQTWLNLAGFDLYTVGDARAALKDLRGGLYLDPQNTDAQSEYVAALRHMNPTAPVVAATPPVAPSNPGPVGPSG